MNPSVLSSHIPDSNGAGVLLVLVLVNRMIADAIGGGGVLVIVLCYTFSQLVDLEELVIVGLCRLDRVV